MFNNYDCFAKLKMKQKTLSKLDCRLASEIALETMQAVSGVVNVAALPGKFDMEPMMSGKGFISANVSLEFIDNNVSGPTYDLKENNEFRRKYESLIKSDRHNKIDIFATWQIEFQKVGGSFSSQFIGSSYLNLGNLKWQIGFVEKAGSIRELFRLLCEQADPTALKYNKSQDHALDRSKGFRWPLISFILGGSLLFLFLGSGSWIITLIIFGAAFLLKAVINRDDPVQPTYLSDADIIENEMDTTPHAETIPFNAGKKIKETINTLKDATYTSHAKNFFNDHFPCPICAENIKKKARKCKHCGEWLSEHK